MCQVCWLVYVNSTARVIGEKRTLIEKKPVVNPRDIFFVIDGGGSSPFSSPGFCKEAC